MSAQARLFDLWIEQIEQSTSSSEQAGHELKRLHQQESRVHEVHQTALDQAQQKRDQAGWWQTAARVCRLGSAALAAAQGGWKGMLAGAGLIGLEIASMTGALDKVEEAARTISPAAATAVRVGTAVASIGLGIYVATKGAGQGGWMGALQSAGAVAAGVSTVGQAVVQSQARHYEAQALELEAELKELETARTQLQQRMELEAQRRNQLLTQMEETMEMWALPA